MKRSFSSRVPSYRYLANESNGSFVTNSLPNCVIVERKMCANNSPQNNDNNRQQPQDFR